MFNSKIALPQDFFYDESIVSRSNIRLSENGSQGTKEQARPFMEWIPFGRASQVVRRDFDELTDDNIETSLNMPNIVDLSPIRFYEEDYSVPSENTVSECNNNESAGTMANIPIFESEVYKGWKSLSELPHPSQLRTKKSVKRKKPLGFDVDCHVQQIQQKSKDLIGINLDDRKVGSGMFPSPNHEYGLNPYRVLSTKRVKMDTNFVGREI